MKHFLFKSLTPQRDITIDVDLNRVVFEDLKHTSTEYILDYVCLSAGGKFDGTTTFIKGRVSLIGLKRTTLSIDKYRSENKTFEV